MKSFVGKTVLLLILSGAAAAQAQEPPRAPRPPAVPAPARVEAWPVPAHPGVIVGVGIANVEAVLRQKEELELTPQQVAQLETIRREEVTRRQNESREHIDLESRYQAGMLDRDAWRDEMEKRSDARTIAARSVRDRIETILTVEQRDKLEERRYRRAPIDGRELIDRIELERAAVLRRVPR
jgi:Spy/CpxP family protein refolding chaperone